MKPLNYSSVIWQFQINMLSLQQIYEILVQPTAHSSRTKWSKIENGIIVGPIIVGIVLIMDYCGYVIVIKGYNIPISTLLLIFGAVWFIAGLVAKMYLSSMDD